MDLLLFIEKHTARVNQNCFSFFNRLNSFLKKHKSHICIRIFNNFKQMKRTTLIAMAIATSIFQSCSNCQTNSNSQKKQNPIENIMTRTSIRQFDGTKISQGQIDTILKAAMAAPTAMNKQPWDFIVVTDQDKLNQLSDAHPYAPIKKGCSLVIAVCGNFQKAAEGAAKEYWIQDASAATENILLAVNALGLGAVWCGVYPMEDRINAISKVLEIPEYVMPLNIICIGKPAENPTPKNKWTESNVHQNKW